LGKDRKRTQKQERVDEKGQKVVGREINGL
jgi:hypothetical protein